MTILDDDSDKEELVISEELVESRQHKQAGTTTINFDGLLAPPLKLHEDLTNGCGGQLWPAGMVLAKYLLRETMLHTLNGKTMFVRCLFNAKKFGGSDSLI